MGKISKIISLFILGILILFVSLIWNIGIGDLFKTQEKIPEEFCTEALGKAKMSLADALAIARKACSNNNYYIKLEDRACSEQSGEWEFKMSVYNENKSRCLNCSVDVETGEATLVECLY